MNTWITEHILQTEIEMRNHVGNAARLKRRTEGWISGYSLKTKRYTRSSEDKTVIENDAQCNLSIADNDDKLCNENDNNKEADQRRLDVPQDQDNANEEDPMCTICLLAVEDGERIADLSCQHVYHADCLGEWILKKVCFITFIPSSISVFLVKPFHLIILDLFTLRIHAHCAKI